MSRLIDEQIQPAFWRICNGPGNDCCPVHYRVSRTQLLLFDKLQHIVHVAIETNRVVIYHDHAAVVGGRRDLE